MAALPRHYIPLIAAPDHVRFAQPGAGAEDGDGFARMSLAVMERQPVDGSEERDAEGDGGEIVDERDVADAEDFAEFRRRDHPLQICHLGPIPENWPGDREAGSINRLFAASDELRQQGIERRIGGAFEAHLHRDLVLINAAEQRLRAANVAGDDAHRGVV